ncbi:MAG TPA: large conductance mechanosensitive channel protein MscL [Kofleriaceae bacterium]|nr:large conductance mechanosensitive channel protein MscL [Kofleriaceae bacterium]
MSLLKEFKAFAVKGNVIDLAVAVVIGAAFTKVVNAIVSAMVMPLVGKVMPAGNWATYTWGGMQLGVVLDAIIQFVVVAAVLFVVVVKFMGALQRRQAEAPPPPSTKKCIECLEEIPLAAKRCRACTSAQAA